MAGGSSSVSVKPSGFPVFSDSTFTNSAVRSSRASAILSIARCRSAGVASPHDSKARSAAR
jgi:hypothetical protein